MVRRVHIPAIADLLILSTPSDIAEAAQHPALDRRFSSVDGSILNELIARRMHRNLRIGDRLLPSAAPRDDEDRQTSQAKLAKRLNRKQAAWDTATLDALADYTLDRTKRPLGLLAQQAVGSAFNKDYVATRDTWRAAQVLDASLRSFNPLRRALWAATEAVPRAQKRLGHPVHDNPAAIHATGIAVHTLVRALETLRMVMADRHLQRSLSTRAVLARAITAPDSVLRQVKTPCTVAGQPMKAGGLVILRTRQAAEAHLDLSTAFLSGSWSKCPADSFVPRMIAEVWARAMGERLDRTGALP
ncbi:hypothetical protein [Qingshengfaniella alkalisoli]|uniref:Uncharacterized protein n=1 Tax=Qingshengfaniella alkalisoli TaxID=2599296 RepID=A0A5B8IZU6_9RHOB|nr:hypothetical protein [Qingshengfaniella alkalisoli]QDY71592.1 hypothetical protein FPZ52_18135 [Qingshengfaniella alkalisoli]